MRTKPLIFFIVVVSLALFIVLRGVGPNKGVRIGEAAPDFAIKDQSGKELKLSDLRGNLVFLNFWATYCVPCIDEMPDMEEMNATFKDRKFEMVAVTLDTEWDVVNEFYEKYNLTLPSYLDPGRRVADQYNVRLIPETFVIDRNGIVLKHYIGQKYWTSPNMYAEFEAMIKQQETPQAASQ